MSTTLPKPPAKPVESDPFAKIKPRMTDNEAAIEANRCLFCHDAPCTIACPSGIDIPLFIRQIASDNATGAARTIFSQNILGKSCAYVCPTQVLCEGSCVYHGLNEKPVDIGRLQGYATDIAIDENIRFFEKGAPTNKAVAVIGGGPAGLACAHELTRLGYDVTVYEASPKAGGLNAYGVAPYKLTNAEAEAEVDYVAEIGFEIQTDTRITPGPASNPGEVSLSDLEGQYDAVFLGIGLGQSRKPGIPGEDLPGVAGAAEWIYELREREQDIDPGERVVVIGAGNTAIDAAVESAKLGAEVTLVYRRSEAEQSAYDFEVAHARHEGVRFSYLTSPAEILGEDRVTGIRCVKNRLAENTGNGKPSGNGKSQGKASIEPIPGSEFVIDCDRVIFATGQEKMTAFYQSISGIALDNGRVIVNADFQTGNPKYFAGGDCVNGGKEVVNAVAHGRDAARGIDRFLSQEGK